jgi:amino acid transporter
MSPCSNASLVITLVLALAANTSFGSLPLLESLLARDNYMPHVFALRDDRQTLSFGIWTLTVMAAVLLIAVRGNTQALIPLFAIGVFTGFTLSQTGMVVHWRNTRRRRWHYRAIINGTGAVVTALATVIFLATKFTDISEALSISNQVICVTVLTSENPDDHSSDGDDRASKLQEEWAQWNPGPPLRILHTEYASIAGPILAFVDQLTQNHHEQIMVLIPAAVPDQPRYRLLHNQYDHVLSNALQSRPDVITARAQMPLHLADDDPQAQPSP